MKEKLKTHSVARKFAFLMAFQAFLGVAYGDAVGDAQKAEAQANYNNLANALNQYIEDHQIQLIQAPVGPVMNSGYQGRDCMVNGSGNSLPAALTMFSLGLIPCPEYGRFETAKYTIKTATQVCRLQFTIESEDYRSTWSTSGLEDCVNQIAVSVSPQETGQVAKLGTPADSLGSSDQLQGCVKRAGDNADAMTGCYAVTRQRKTEGGAN
jgi:hypothetical protein